MVSVIPGDGVHNFWRWHLSFLEVIFIISPPSPKWRLSFLEVVFVIPWGAFVNLGDDVCYFWRWYPSFLEEISEIPVGVYQSWRGCPIVFFCADPFPCPGWSFLFLSQFFPFVLWHMFFSVCNPISFKVLSDSVLSVLNPNSLCGARQCLLFFNLLGFQVLA